MVSPLIKYASLLGFTALSTAAPTSTPLYPPTLTADNFNLVVNVTGSDLTPSINDYVLTSYHVGAGEAYAVLIPNTTATSARTFYLNGTAEDVEYHNADILSDGGTPPFPEGLVVNPSTTVDSLGRHDAFINAGLGTAGVGLTGFPEPVHWLYGPQGEVGSFIACNTPSPPLPYGAAITLNYLYEGEAVPESCTTVKLLPQCAVGDGVVHEFGNTVNCYEDVAGIDWSIYYSS